MPFAQLIPEKVTLIAGIQLWNSEHNKALIAKMPKSSSRPESRHRRARPIPVIRRRIRLYPRAPSGGVAKDKAPLPFAKLQPGRPVPGRQIASIADGTSGTLMVAEAADAVEWTKPDELPFRRFPFGPTPPKVPKLGGLFPGGFHGLMCDGARPCRRRAWGR